MNRPDRDPGSDRDAEHGYHRAMLALTVALAALATVVAVLVAIFPDDDGDGPQPVPSPSVTAAADSAADGVDGRGEHPRESLGGRDQQPARG